jgi:hypothetical protein
VCDTDANKRTAIAGANAQNTQKAIARPLKMTARSCKRAHQATKNQDIYSAPEKISCRNEKIERVQL